MVHFAVLLIPFCVLTYIFLKIISPLNAGQIFQYIGEFWWLCLFIISAGMCFYIILDFIFGFTVTNMSRGTKDIRTVKQYEKIYEIFTVICEKFRRKNVRLHIMQDETINAYALGTFNKSRIFITTGLMQHMQGESADDDEFYKSISGVLGHEMSHIVNMDFLPGTLSYIAEKTMHRISYFLDCAVMIVGAIVSVVPVFGKLTKMFILKVYQFVNTIFVELCYQKIVLPLDYFISMMLSRRVEYRSDRDSAKALGGDCIAIALEKLNDSSGVWRSIFSTHPPMKYRIKKATKISKTDDSIHISPSFITDFANMWCIVMLFFATICLGFKANLPKMPHYFATIMQMSYEKYTVISEKITALLALLKTLYGILQKLSQII